MDKNKSKKNIDSSHVSTTQTKSMKKELGKKLLSIRKSIGYSQQEVASLIGISRAALSYYEKGERSLDIETLYKLSSLYQISIDYLFGLKTSSTPEHDATSINEMKEIGFSAEAIDIMWSSPDCINLINDLVLHKDFYKLEQLTYHSRYTLYEEIDTGYRSFLTSKLLYSMIADIFKQWYIDNPERIKDLTTTEKEQLAQEIEDYFKERSRINKLYETGNYPEALASEQELDAQLRMLYSKLKKYM